MYATQNQKRDHAIVFTRGTQRFYGVKSRGETFEMVEEVEPRCVMTENDARNLFKKIINTKQWSGIKIVKIL